MDTGAEVSLLKFINYWNKYWGEKNRSAPSINYTPAYHSYRWGWVAFKSWISIETKWRFLIIENLTDSVLGADFIDCHHSESWGIKNNKLYLDEVGIPLVTSPTCGAIHRDTYAPVVARCTVELPARHQVMIPMRSKEKKTGFFNLLGHPVVFYWPKVW